MHFHDAPGGTFPRPKSLHITLAQRFEDLETVGKTHAFL